MRGFFGLRAFLAALLLVSAGAAGAVTVGNDVIDRKKADQSNNFILGLEDSVFTDGFVTDWSVFIRRFDDGANSAIGLLALEMVSGDKYEVKAIDLQSAVLGLNTFSGGFRVEAGWILGAYVTDAKIAFSNDGSSPVKSWGGRPVTTVGIGDFVTLGRELSRTYSLSATVAPVPLPAAAPLLLVGLGALVLLGRRHAA